MIMVSPYKDEHIETYNALAGEYESRASALESVTISNVEFLCNHLMPGASILDVGCGVGLATKVMSDKGFNPTGIDIATQMLNFARESSRGRLRDWRLFGTLF
jgi:2-polyprenyl-3-methyl-5-hydroxy-6-metoxy-1,4-benzoquinol methylase